MPIRPRSNAAESGFRPPLRSHCLRVETLRAAILLTIGMVFASGLGAPAGAAPDQQGETAAGAALHVSHARPRVEQSDFSSDASLSQQPWFTSAQIRSFLGTGIQRAVLVILSVALVVTVLVARHLRGRSEAALRESEGRYRSLFDNATDLVFALDLKGTFTNANDAAEIHARCSPEELIGMNFLEYVVRDQRLRVLRAFRRLYKTGKPLKDFPIQVRLKDGTEKWFELSIGLLRDGARAVGFQGSGRDVTDRVRAQRALTESEERYRTIFAAIATPTLTFAESGKIVLANREAEQLLDCSKEELEGKALWTEFLLPDDADLMWNTARLIRTRPALGPKSSEARIKRRNGEIRNVFITVAMLPGTSQYIASMIDITARKLAEDALRLSEAHYRTLFDHASDAIYIHGLDGQFIEVNNATLERWGYRRGELLEKSAYDIDEPEHAHRIPERIDELVKTGNVFFETAHMTKDGRIAPAEVSSRLIDYHGKKAVLSIARDVGEKKSAQKALQRRLEEQMVLHAVAVAGVEATSLDGLIDRATLAVGTILFPDHFGVGLVEDRTGDIRIHDSYRGISKDERMRRIPAGKGIAGRVVATAQPSRVPEVTVDPAYIPIGAPDMRTELCVPIKVGNQVVGVINAESRRPAAFSEADERLMMILAGQIATGMERLRLLESERHRVAELEALRATMTDISSELESSRLLRIIVERACAILNATSGELALSDQESDTLCVVVSHNTGRDYTGTRIASGEGAMGTVVESGQPLIVEDYAAWDDRSPQYTDALWHAVLAVPLVAGSQLMGVISVSDSDASRRFTESDQRLLIMLAQQAGIAVENARLFREVQQLAITDSLTGLYNRRHLFELGRRELVRAQRYRRALSVLMLDIDHFKEVNDSFGHAAGDQILRTVAVRCRGCLREIDLVGRYGGEEFLAMLPETSEDGARLVAEEIRERIAVPVEVETDRISVTVSLGVVVLNTHTDTLEELVEHADRALYEAKKAGRNRVHVWDGSSRRRRRRKNSKG